MSNMKVGYPTLPEVLRDMDESLRVLAEFGGRWSTAASAVQSKERVQAYLEKRGIPYALSYHPRPGWQFVVLPPDERER